MRIIGKSRIKKEDLIGKGKISPYIEIQLFDEYDKNIPIENLYKETINIKDIDILGVHVPLCDGDAVNIEEIGCKKDKEKIIYTIELSNLLAKYYNHKIKVVMHTQLKFEKYEKFPQIYNDILTFFKQYMTKEYELLEFCFENVVIFKFNKGIECRDAFFENIKLAKALNEYFNTDKFGTCLDTCHALSSERILQSSLKEYEILRKEFTFEDFFKNNKDTIKLIHLCDVKDLGFNKGEHGIKFDNIKDMENIVNLYKKYNYNCDITIEITETDYVKNDNFKENYNMLKSILKEK